MFIFNLLRTNIWNSKFTWMQLEIWSERGSEGTQAKVLGLAMKGIFRTSIPTSIPKSSWWNITSCSRSSLLLQSQKMDTPIRFAIQHYFKSLQFEFWNIMMLKHFFFVENEKNFFLISIMKNLPIHFTLDFT